MVEGSSRFMVEFIVACPSRQIGKVGSLKMSVVCRFDSYLGHQYRSIIMDEVDRFWDILRRNCCATKPYTDATRVVMVSREDIKKVLKEMKKT